MLTYYGWAYTDYTTSADWTLVQPNTNTGFAKVAVQAPLVAARGFSHNVFVFNQKLILNLVYQNAGVTMPPPDQYGVIWHANYIPNFRSQYFLAYQSYMSTLNAALISNGTYDAFDLFFLADEPALNRNIYLDQAFLDQCVSDFKTAFSDKTSLVGFAQDLSSGAANYARGPHYTPPAELDIVMVDPYLPRYMPVGLVITQSLIKQWLYQNNTNSNINWALQFGKPVIVAGDAELRSGIPLPDIFYQSAYSILKADPAVSGLFWFVYNKSYVDGVLSGGGNSPYLVSLIAGL